MRKSPEVSDEEYLFVAGGASVSWHSHFFSFGRRAPPHTTPKDEASPLPDPMNLPVRRGNSGHD